MIYHYIEELEYIEPQNIPTYKRNGFTFIEWGGWVGVFMMSYFTVAFVRKILR